jgi:hypothetical protein
MYTVRYDDAILLVSALKPACEFHAHSAHADAQSQYGVVILLPSCFFNGGIDIHHPSSFLFLLWGPGIGHCRECHQLTTARPTGGLGTVHSPQSSLARSNVIGQFTRANFNSYFQYFNQQDDCPAPALCTATRRMVHRYVLGLV